MPRPLTPAVPMRGRTTQKRVSSTARLLPLGRGWTETMTRSRSARSATVGDACRPRLPCSAPRSCRPRCLRPIAKLDRRCAGRAEDRCAPASTRRRGARRSAPARPARGQRRGAVDAPAAAAVRRGRRRGGRRSPRRVVQSCGGPSRQISRGSKLEVASMVSDDDRGEGEQPGLGLHARERHRSAPCRPAARRRRRRASTSGRRPRPAGTGARARAGASAAPCARSRRAGRARRSSAPAPRCWR